MTVLLFKWYKITAGVVIGIGVAGVLGGVICLIPVHMPTPVLYTILGTLKEWRIVLSVLGGAAAAFFFIAKFRFLVKYVIGAVGGILAAVLLNPIGPSYIAFFVFFIIAPLLLAGGIFLSKKKFILAYICTVHVMAAYLVVRGFSAFIGHYPNTIEFYSNYKGSELKVRIDDVVEVSGGGDCLHVGGYRTGSWRHSFCTYEEKRPDD
eukprot:TRINITY_DN3668_c0_g2_i8.p2 TRINITY_DN3668_c0_g2~~TRINITY_DN3668_c0_g2_i8.p2  ORF type:complete len:207 (-),score=9.24 TRINITY_DN3668_c0_g2_i8:161-781(-)